MAVLGVTLVVILLQQAMTPASSSATHRNLPGSKVCSILGHKGSIGAQDAGNSAGVGQHNTGHRAALGSHFQWAQPTTPGCGA
jgi:hypothetical protein